MNNDNSKSVVRAGVIPYFDCDNGDRIYFVGVDTGSKEYSDWGGKVEKFDGNPYETASRELKEESLGCIDLSPQQISSGIILSDGKTLISLVDVNKEMLLSSITTFYLRYNQIVKKNAKSEMCGIRLLTTKDLENCIKKGQIYSVVASVLSTDPKKVKIIL